MLETAPQHLEIAKVLHHEIEKVTRELLGGMEENNILPDEWK